MNSPNFQRNPQSSLGDATGTDIAVKTTISMSDTQRIEIEVSCIDLISHLEHDLSVAKEGYRGDHVDQSADTSRTMLYRMLDFCEAHLNTKLDQLVPVVSAAIEAANRHRLVIKKRSWAGAILSTFVDRVGEEDAHSHERLGKAMNKACAAVLSKTVEVVGINSEVGQQIQQSMQVFTTEFTETW